MKLNQNTRRCKIALPCRAAWISLTVVALVGSLAGCSKKEAAPQVNLSDVAATWVEDRAAESGGRFARPEAAASSPLRQLVLNADGTFKASLAGGTKYVDGKWSPKGNGLFFEVANNTFEGDQKNMAPASATVVKLETGDNLAVFDASGMQVMYKKK